MTEVEKELKKAELKFQIGVAKIAKTYNIKRIEIVNYQIYNAYTNIIIDNLKENHIEESLLILNDNSINYESFIEIHETISNQSRSYEIINNDLVYKLNFQIFEEFLSELIYFSLDTFPGYLNSIDKKNDLPYDHIFGNDSSIENIKDYIITAKVKSIVQSNNIIDILTKIERIFSMKFEISDLILDALFVSSMNRNIMTHNNGVVNDIYLGQLKYRGIKTTLSKGDAIFNQLNISADQNNQEIIVQIISNIFDKEAERLVIHHSKLT